jgi:hypothetical protein
MRQVQPVNFSVQLIKSSTQHSTNAHSPAQHLSPGTLKFVTLIKFPYRSEKFFQKKYQDQRSDRQGGGEATEWRNEAYPHRLVQSGTKRTIGC